MEIKSKKNWRHFLQFRISTWFLLVAILAWLMTTDYDFFTSPPLNYSEVAIGFTASWQSLESFGVGPFEKADHISVEA